MFSGRRYSLISPPNKDSAIPSTGQESSIIAITVVKTAKHRLKLVFASKLSLLSFALFPELNVVHSAGHELILVFPCNSVDFAS
jgi:hypothetical protein